MTAALPAEFADLEPFADWALEHERDRYAKRLAARWTSCRRSTTPPSRGSRTRRRTSTRSTSTTSPTTRPHLLWLCYSLVNVSFPVEVWRQPRVPDSGAATMDQVVEPGV